MSTETIVKKTHQEEVDAYAELLSILSEEEKERINNILKNNEDKYQAELREKYNPDNLFKKQKSEILNLENNTITEETAIIEYKEKNFLQKIFDKIKHLFKRN